jgi:general nucleoside transport system permease protein
MLELDLTILLASIVAVATPVVLATLGETITEKAGIVNLSLDGTILLSAMVAFAVSYESHSLFLGFASGALVGAAVAAIVAVFGIWLGQSQVAVGFVLTLMTRDLAYFLGNSYTRLQGPQVSPLPIYGLKSLPGIGPIFFNHSLPVYFSLLLVFICWWYIYRTPAGLTLRAIGEHPEAAFARGINPQRWQLVYALIGGALVGLGGATFSLLTKPGWGRPQGAEGTGWIVLALVIFGGWHPVKAVIGAYLFAFLQVMGIYFQNWLPGIPAQVFQVAPFPLMIFALVLTHLARNETFAAYMARLRLKPLLEFLTGQAPSALGKPYRRN